ncbi:hypothetical protein J3459_014942 [Metarhizium acridum]|nr:hypothetical protein J3459_014942 [Metarhizium acridum]
MLELADLDELDAIELSAFEEPRLELAGFDELYLDIALEYPSVEEVTAIELTGFENVGLETVGLELVEFEVDLADVKEEGNELAGVEKLGGFELSMYDELPGTDELDGIG